MSKEVRRSCVRVYKNMCITSVPYVKSNTETITINLKLYDVR